MGLGVGVVSGEFLAELYDSMRTGFFEDADLSCFVPIILFQALSLRADIIVQGPRCECMQA